MMPSIRILVVEDEAVVAPAVPGEEPYQVAVPSMEL